MKYHLNIGSNLGDKESNIRSAISAIEDATRCDATASSFIETEAWGYDSENKFINVAIAIESTIKPDDMLALLQQVEQSIDSHSHRNADGTYKDRIIDIDIIAIDEMVIKTERLSIPHPRMHLRKFVLAPLAEIAPEWSHPILHQTAKELLTALS